MIGLQVPAGVRPSAAEVPPDVGSFLDGLAASYERHDIKGLASALTEGFLFEGMRREAFLENAQRSFLWQRIDRMRIVPILLEESGGAIQLVAYAETNLGVLPQAPNLLPLTGGCRLVSEAGHWMLDGNQRRSPVGIYTAFRSLSVLLPVDDPDLYRALLPTRLMPAEDPRIRLMVIDWAETIPPLQPYREVQLQLACRLDGRGGWYAVTMPESDWMAIEGGRTLGYPKYPADEIGLDRDGDAWLGCCTHARDPRLTLTMRFEPDEHQASLYARATRSSPLALVRRMLPPYREQPWFLFMPGGADPDATPLVVRGEMGNIGLPRIHEEFGRVHISLEGDEPWVALLKGSTDAAGSILEYVGHMTLSHRLAS